MSEIKKSPRDWLYEFFAQNKDRYTDGSMLEDRTAELIAGAFRVEYGIEPRFGLPISVGDLIRAFERTLNGS